LPFAFCFPHVIPPLGEGRFLVFGCRQSAVSLAGFSVKVKKNLRAIGGVVNPQVRCKSQILGKKFSRTVRYERNREQTLLEPRYGSRQAAEQQIKQVTAENFPQAADWNRDVSCPPQPGVVHSLALACRMKSIYVARAGFPRPDGR
jgi:hypothetical protein